MEIWHRKKLFGNRCQVIHSKNKNIWERINQKWYESCTKKLVIVKCYLMQLIEKENMVCQEVIFSIFDLCEEMAVLHTKIANNCSNFKMRQEKGKLRYLQTVFYVWQCKRLASKYNQRKANSQKKIFFLLVTICPKLPICSYLQYVPRCSYNLIVLS